MGKAIRKLREYYLNKICTVITKEPSIPLKNSLEHSKYFTGEVVDLDETGIWLKSLEFKTVAFFFFPVIAIVEEQFVAQGTVQADKIKAEIAKQNPNKSQYIPIEDLTKKVQSLKK